MENWFSAKSKFSGQPSTTETLRSRVEEMKTLWLDVPTVRRSSSLEWLRPHMSDPRVDPLENSWSQRSSDLNIRPEDHERKLSINKQAIQKLTFELDRRQQKLS